MSSARALLEACNSRLPQRTNVIMHTSVLNRLAFQVALILVPLVAWAGAVAGVWLGLTCGGGVVSGWSRGGLVAHVGDGGARHRC